jgi:hypothetical protein
MSRAAAIRKGRAPARARPRSPVAERMRRYRRNLQSGIVFASVPLDGEILGYLLRAGFLRRDREIHTRDEIAAAARAALERLARSR